MLKKIRISLAAVMFAAVILLFLDFTGKLHTGLTWAAKAQAVEAVLALNSVVIVTLLAVTLLFGRVYCSVICPLGIMQDIVSFFGGKHRKARFRYRKPLTWLRYTFLGVFILLMLLGLNSIAALIAPYSAFGRIMAAIGAAFGNRAVSIPVLVVAAVTFILLFILAWRNGRIWCNAVCPVGTMLGILSKVSIFKPVIDTSKCNGCTICSRKCKSSCINPAEHRIDYSRCVVCMDCMDNCRQGAISYKFKPYRNMSKNTKNEPADMSRRKFLTAGLMLASAATLNAKGDKIDSGIAMLQDKKVPARETPVKPAGSRSLKNFSDHCVSCQLCVTKCPSSVLQPSTRISTLMQPEMLFDKGFCSPICNTCSTVCPSGAIKPVSIEEKSSIRVGHAVVLKENCIGCGKCAKECPAGAISMTGTGRERIPAVNAERCIGCGKCEFSCPAKPQVAIYIEGNEIHSIA